MAVVFNALLTVIPLSIGSSLLRRLDAVASAGGNTRRGTTRFWLPFGVGGLLSLRAQFPFRYPFRNTMVTVHQK